MLIFLPASARSGKTVVKEALTLSTKECLKHPECDLDNENVLSRSQVNKQQCLPLVQVRFVLTHTFRRSTHLYLCVPSLHRCMESIPGAARHSGSGKRPAAHTPRPGCAWDFRKASPRSGENTYGCTGFSFFSSTGKRVVQTAPHLQPTDTRVK